MSRPQSHERPYHHGDLRRVIVKAALEILRETQSLEFSLRELARRAGVSHNAPYKHFADKRELLEAVSAAGFEMLTKRMTNEIAGFHSPREQLFALLRAYIDHGVENPALYSLMFGGYLTGPNHGRPAIELAAAEKTKALLAGVIIAGGVGRGHRRQALTRGSWSAGSSRAGSAGRRGSARSRRRTASSHRLPARRGSGR